MPKFVPSEDGKMRFRSDREITGVDINIEYRRECPDGGRSYPLELRQTADGRVRDQPKCAQCRWKASKGQEKLGL